MTKCKTTPSLVSLAQELRAALIENMFGVTTSDDYRPVAWMGRYPVDVTTMLVGIHVAAAILAAILVAFGAGSVLLWLQFDSAAIWSSGQVWRLFTYAFVHAPSGLLWFAIEMYLSVRLRARSGTFSRPSAPTSHSMPFCWSHRQRY